MRNHVSHATPDPGGDLFPRELHMSKPRRYQLRETQDRPLGWDELDALERELVSDLVAAISSSKRRHRPDYGTPAHTPSRTGQLALEMTP